MTAFLVLRLKTWDRFEPMPGPFARLPVTIQGQGMGFCCVFATREEAERDAQGRYTICEVAMSKPQEADPS